MEHIETLKVIWWSVQSAGTTIAIILAAVALIGLFLKRREMLQSAREITQAAKDIRELSPELDKIKDGARDLRAMSDSLRPLQTDIEKILETVNTLRSEVRAMKEDAESQLGSQTPGKKVPAERDVATSGETRTKQQAEVDKESQNWEEVRTIWQKVRDRVQEVIDGIGNAKKREAYAVMPRRNYYKILRALEVDGRLTAQASAAAREMDASFRRLRNRYEWVTDATVAKYKEWLDTFERGAKRGADTSPPWPFSQKNGT